MPDSTSALISQLSNPPNPLTQFGGTFDLANKVKEFQANQAAANAYQQSIDPETGAFDQGKFNAIASQLPGGAWKFGAQMQQAGQGSGAQGEATSANTIAAQRQLSLLSGYMTPLLQAANNGQDVTQDQVRDTINNAIGLTPQMRAAALAKLGTLQPGQTANSLLLGWQYATQSPEGQASRTLPTIDQNQKIVDWLTTPGEYPDPADPTKKKYGTRGSFITDYGGDPGILTRGVQGGGFVPLPGTGVGTAGQPRSGAGSQGGGKGAPGPQSSAGDGTGNDPRGVVPYIRQAAIARGIDPDIAVKVAASEGLAEFSGDGGQSGGAFQLHVTPQNKGGHVGDRFMQDTGLDPLDPKNEKATIDYALDTAAKNGWGEWNGAKRIGITGFTGIGKPPTQTASAPAAPTDAAPGDNGYPFPTLTPEQAASIPPVGGQKSAVVAPPLPPNTTNWAGGSWPMSTAFPPSSAAAAAGRVLAPGGGAQFQPPPVRLAASGFPTGTVTYPATLPQTTEASGKKYTADLQQYDELPQRISPLTQAAGILKTNPNLGTGTGAEDVQKLASLAQTFGFTLSPQANDNLTAFTELNKDLERYYLSKPGSSRSDLAQTETKMSQPSTAMQREALQDLVGRTIGLERANSAPLVNFQQQHGVGNAANYAPQYQAESAAYRNTLDPVAFGFDYMTPQERRAYWSSLDDDGKRKYEYSIKEASRLFGIGIPR